MMNTAKNTDILSRSMKKTAKPRKTAGKAKKRSKKSGFSDGIKAFFLVCIIVALSALISCAVIMVHSSLKEGDLPQDIVSSGIEENQESRDVDVFSLILPKIEPKTESEQKIESVQKPAERPVLDSGISSVVTPPISTAAAVTMIVPGITERPKENLGTLVFVIDDAGNNLRELEPFLRIPGPLTIAVLPGLPYSAEAARRIRAAGKEVILHQPMEAIHGQNPGPGAIYSHMSADEIRAILARNIAEVGPVTGINNHQGSKITMNREIMQVILSFCKENNLYFLDSKTTADSIVPVLAGQMGVSIAERNVFIDNEQNKDAMLRYISGGLTRAQRNGSAVMIGHTWSPALAPLLTEQFPLYMEQGYTIKSVSDIIKR